MIDWKIQSRSHGCQACGKAFADKQAYFTLLVEHRHELIRQDVCAPCWEAKYSQGAKENKEFISFWQGVFNQAPPPPPEAIQKESAESLLRKLTERANPEYAAACFILAVMLERKRMLKVKAQSTQDGRRTIIYEHPKTGDVFSIVDPDLHLDKLVEVQRTVSHLLENGLPGGAQVESGASSTAEDDVPTAPEGAQTVESTLTDSESATDITPPESKLSEQQVAQPHPPETSSDSSGVGLDQTDPEPNRATIANNLTSNTSEIISSPNNDAGLDSNDSYVTAA